MIFPAFDPAIFTIPQFHLGSLALGPFAIRWYALAYVAGILLGWRYCVGLVKNTKLWGGKAPTASVLQLDDLVLWITLGVIIGGRLGYVLFYMLPDPQQSVRLAQDWTMVFRVWEGGMSFHGGMIGVFLAVGIFARVNKINLLMLGDLVAPCEPIGQFFGRVANFINGELWGRETTLPWGVRFCNDAIRQANMGVCPAGDIPRHPSQLYEAGLEGLLIFFVLRWATHKVHWLQKKGAVTGLFLILYGMIRVILETVREPDIGMPIFPMGLTMGIMLSLPMVAAGVFLLWLALRQAPPQTKAA